MSLERTRKALRIADEDLCWTAPHDYEMATLVLNPALAELDKAEAVIQAARDCVREYSVSGINDATISDEWFTPLVTAVRALDGPERGQSSSDAEKPI